MYRICESEMRLAAIELSVFVGRSGRVAGLVGMDFINKYLRQRKGIKKLSFSGSLSATDAKCMRSYGTNERRRVPRD